MKMNMKTAGIVAASAALLYIPARLLYKWVAKSMTTSEPETMEAVRTTSHLKRKAHKRHLIANKGLNWH